MAEVSAGGKSGFASRAVWRRHGVRRAAAGLVVLGAALSATIVMPPRPVLVWNASASAPVGLYRVIPSTRLATGDMVIARLPAAMRGLAAGRHYLPANVPLVKRVAALSGDTVCAHGAAVSVNGRRVAVRRMHDGAGRAMPWWSGCVTLSRGAALLLMTGSPDSFDGRYFGPTCPGLIVGKAHLVWASRVSGRP